MMKCKYCGTEMELDDVDFNYKGNKDNYYLCPKCDSTAIEEIRDGTTVNIRFRPSDASQLATY